MKTTAENPKLILAKPAWTKILSEGHHLVPRINKSKEWDSYAPQIFKAKIQTGIVVVVVSAIVLVLGVALVQSISYKLSKYASESPSNVDEIINKHMSLAPDINEMVVGAIDNVEAEGRSKDIRNLMLEVKESLNLSNKLPEKLTFSKWPEIGQPWPADAVVSKAVGNDVIFFGARIKDNYDRQKVWFGAAKKDKKWDVYSIQTLNNSTVVFEDLNKVSEKFIYNSLNEAFPKNK